MPKSGYCSVGHHEGGRYPGPSGKLNKTCHMIETCTCDHPQCHQFYDRMFEASGQVRTVVDNSGYVREIMHFEMPVPVVVEAPSILSTEARELPPDTLESVAPGLAPPVRPHVWTPTPSGRAGRGELESQVNLTCTAWLVDQDRVACTPKYISEEIAKREGIKPPSVGAIDACFKRWEEIGYAIIARKPTRFTGFTEDAVKWGLDELKRRSKRGA